MQSVVTRQGPITLEWKITSGRTHIQSTRNASYYVTAYNQPQTRKNKHEISARMLQIHVLRVVRLATETEETAHQEKIQNETDHVDMSSCVYRHTQYSCPCGRFYAAVGCKTKPTENPSRHFRFLFWGAAGKTDRK